MRGRFRDPLIEIAPFGATVSAELIATVLARVARWAPAEVSRAQLAAGWAEAPRQLDRRTLPQASTSKAVTRLIEAKLLAEGDRRPAGKRHYVWPLRLGTGYVTAAAHVAMELGRPVAVTTILCDIVGWQIHASESEEIGNPEAGPWPALASTIHRHVCLLLDGHDRSRDRDGVGPELFGLGVEVGAPVFDGKVTPIVNKQHFAPQTIDLEHELRVAFGAGNRFPDIPIIVENDAAALAALAIRELGYGFSDLAVVAVFHAGVGGGLVMDGRVRRGKSGKAMEVGHIVVDHPPGHPVPGREPLELPDTAKWVGRDEEDQPAECTCGAIGHVDGIATPRAILAKLGASADQPRLDVAVRNVPYREGRLLLSRAGAALGQALSHVCNVVDPSELIVYLPAEITDSAPGSPLADYRRAVSAEITATFAVDAVDATEIVFRSLPDEPVVLQELGARAAAVCVLDAIIEHASEGDLASRADSSGDAARMPKA
ncbi:ROK family protein [Nocardia sp. NPDC052566]|uniref:ROK family protein n=1 Tax=Nocardia sp. NPDC052566 TaxID=3364330 RepID=UPI0037C720C8